MKTFSTRTKATAAASLLALSLLGASTAPAVAGPLFGFGCFGVAGLATLGSLFVPGAVFAAGPAAVAMAETTCVALMLAPTM